MKRSIDITITLIVLLFFSPIGLLLLIILKITGEHEVFYLQKRIGKGGKEFGIYKFVTMIKDSPNIGARDITIKNDPRVLPFGKFLRKTKLNEFPQFINVLIGEMSIVGPRPLVENQYNMIPLRYQQKINKMKPGITGVGSIIFRDEEQYLKGNEQESNKFYKEEIVPFKSKLECWYEANQSIFVDIKIIITTFIIIFFPRFKSYQLLFNNLPKHTLFNPH